MPLSEGTSKAARQENIEKEISAGKKPEQAVAIGYSEQRKNIAKKAVRSKDGTKINRSGGYASAPGKPANPIPKIYGSKVHDAVRRLRDCMIPFSK